MACPVVTGKSSQLNMNYAVSSMGSLWVHWLEESPGFAVPGLCSFIFAGMPSPVTLAAWPFVALHVDSNNECCIAC